jgi:hypothetical protein
MRFWWLAIIAQGASTDYRDHYYLQKYFDAQYRE